MKLTQQQNLLKTIILGGLCIIVLILHMPMQISAYYAMAALEQQQQQQQSPTYSAVATEVPKKEKESTKETRSLENRKTTIGAWDPYQMPIQKIQGTKQTKAIKTLLKQGFSEYYFVMNDFNDSKEKSLIESLLKSADNTDLKILIILLPPSEGGPNGNYDWKGWIDYFNNLKDKHKSFKGFTIDDFNWINTRRDKKFLKNIDYMIYSNLSKALSEKREDVGFYPIIYFEGEKTNTVISEYSKFIDGAILASACYYNITNLEKDLLTFARMFDNQPIRYIVYPTTTYNYSRQNYNQYHP